MNRLLPLVTTGLALLCTSAALASPPLELKGVRLGMSQDALVKKFPTLECSDIGNMYIVCKHAPTPDVSSDLDTLAEEPIDSWQFYFANDKLGAVIVLFPRTSSKEIIPTLSKKYGKPTHSDTESVQTKMGPRFTCGNMAWSRGDHRIEYKDCAGNVNVSRLSLISVKFAEESKKAGETGLSRRAKDL